MIVINARFLTQKMTGVQRYAFELCDKLPTKINGEDVVFITPNKELKSTLNSNVTITKFGCLDGPLWEQVDLPIFLNKNGKPLLINLVGIGPAFYSNKIMALHDLAFKHHPKWFSYSFRSLYNLLIPISIKNSRRLITVSKYVKTDIIDTYKIDSNKIEVIYASASEKFICNGNQSKEKIILTVSSIDPRKNLENILKAYCSIETDYKLVIVGAQNKVFASNSLNIDNVGDMNVKFTGYVSDNDLVELYNKAEVFIYASLFEGFGIPPLEAQACGCPCVVSNVTSLPEIYNDSVIYCDPYSVRDIRIKLEELILDSEKKECLKEKGINNANKYSWVKSSNQLLNLINSVK